MDPCPAQASTKVQPNSLQDRIARAYYSHGLFCSSHPYSVIIITLVILAICCYPLLRLPLLGSSSQHFTTLLHKYVPPTQHTDDKNDYKFTEPRWFQGPPVGYIQQIIVKSAVTPWNADLILVDAFRAPLAEAFRIRELINNHQTTHNSNQTVSLDDLCFQVSEPLDKYASQLLPHFQCLIVSPTNVWKHDFDMFREDSNLIKTVLALRDYSVDSSSFKEILFGVPWKETGIKQFNVRRRPRVLTYAFTIVFQSFHSDFLKSLQLHLKTKYSVDPYPENSTFKDDEKQIAHIHFQELHAFAEFIPLGVAYTILFLYIYFSVRKIELVKSKWALAISAVMTVMMSLFMSVGLCLWFGLNPTLNGSEILPYLIVVIGLENMLVLTKSVVSTPDHLDVKLRIAQGLSKEGWSITKNLLAELALLTVAFLTFVPKIQEFCLFAVVGLLTDFFLQLVFFATFLSIDIRRIEISDLHKSYQRRKLSSSINYRHPIVHNNVCFSKKTMPPIADSRTAAAATQARRKKGSQDSSAKVFAPTSNIVLGELPKRLKFIYFWARTRMVQRGLMACLVVWIFFWACSSSIMDMFSEGSLGFTVISYGGSASNGSQDAPKPSEHSNPEYSTAASSTGLKHQSLFLWQSLSPQHWTTLFGYYNISLSGRYISVLPPMHVSIPLSSEIAMDLRTPGDIETSKRPYWQILSSLEKAEKDVDNQHPVGSLYHLSIAEMVVILIAIVIVTYSMVVLYRCMCTKHYAEWRSSWKNGQSSVDSRRGSSMSLVGPDQYLITETLPLKLHLHSQEVEYIVSDGNAIASACLNGDICVWDPNSGDCITSIKRSRLTTKYRKSTHHARTEMGSFSSDSTYSSSPLSDDADLYSAYVPTLPSPIVKSNAVPKYFHNQQSNIQQLDAFEQQLKGSNNVSMKYDGVKYPGMMEPLIKDEAECYPGLLERGNSVMYSPPTRGPLPGPRMSHEEQEEPRQMSFYSPLTFQAIWCMDFCYSCIAVGCKEGRLEVWNSFTGNLEYVHEESKSGITALSLTESRLLVARLNGTLDFFAIEMQNVETHCNNTGVQDSITEQHNYSSIHCIWLHSVKAHTLAVSFLEMDNMFAVSGGFDRLIKVFKVDSAATVYTLHGHIGPISALHIDEYIPASAASGCQEGLICLWDLMTGACMYSLKAHQGEVMTLKLTDIYMISEGTDNRICIWEKCQGHLLHTINQEFNLLSNFVLLTSNIMVTAKEDNLLLWDVNHGEALRMIMVGNNDHSCYIKQLRLSGQSVICDYGPQIFIVNFPAVTDKMD